MDATLSTLTLQALELSLVLALPALLSALAAGVVMGMLQSATQIQDPALSFVPRLIAVGCSLGVTGAAMSERLAAFANTVLAELPKLAL